jgi:cell division protein FtsB
VTPRPDVPPPASSPVAAPGEEVATGTGLGLPQGLTTRAAVLGLVLCAMVLSAAVPLREFLAQRSEITRTAAAQSEQRGRVAALEARQQQLRDPAYVEQVARERLHFVMPGETVYVVLRPGEAPAPAAERGEAAPTGPERPWYGQLWDSVEAADRPAAPPAPAP